MTTDSQATSRALFERARRVAPGGVHSPVRAFRDVGGTPRFMQSGRGAKIFDVDGREYIDFCLSFGPLILGHADPDVRRACKDAIDRGSTFGAADAISLELAELICATVPWIDSVRFVNSGTEAVMSALRLARAATGRDKIVKFDGCYHGHADAMLIKSGSGLAGQSVVDSAGIASGVSADTLVAPLDDEAAFDALVRPFDSAIAAVIIEPLPANYGLLPQRPEFLRHVAERCAAIGALLIFDEVITGFRVGEQGMAGELGITPDIVTWGKVIGGGFPVGAFAARRELMELIAPAGPVYQAGTLSGNPVAMTAGLATLKKLMNTQGWRQLAELGNELECRLDANKTAGLTRVGSVFWLRPGCNETDVPPRGPAEIPVRQKARFAEVFRSALDGGIYLPPSAYECAFLSLAHEPSHLDQLAELLAPDAP